MVSCIHRLPVIHGMCWKLPSGALHLVPYRALSAWNVFLQATPWPALSPVSGFCWLECPLLFSLPVFRMAVFTQHRVLPFMVSFSSMERNTIYCMFYICVYFVPNQTPSEPCFLGFTPCVDPAPRIWAGSDSFSSLECGRNDAWPVPVISFKKAGGFQLCALESSFLPEYHGIHGPDPQGECKCLENSVLWFPASLAPISELST